MDMKRLGNPGGLKLAFRRNNILDAGDKDLKNTRTIQKVRLIPAAPGALSSGVDMEVSVHICCGFYSEFCGHYYTETQAG